MEERQKSNISDLFYNKRSNFDRSLFIEKRARLMQTNPIPASMSTNILGHSQIFKVFNKQSLALKNAKEYGMGLMVFAFEGKAVGEGGTRKFLVCHPRMLWKNIKDRPPDYQCTYEVIPEFTACKLYFDLEFSTELNPELDGNSLTILFIQIVNYYLLKEFNINCNLGEVLDLDSSTNKKLSRHLIYNHSDIYFENNYHVGRFVNMICENLKEMFDETSKISIPNTSHDQIKKLFVKTSSSTGLFCDQGVYTKNRNFRIYGSTKLGKHASLVVSKQNKYEPVLHTNSLDENYFLDSLITYVTCDVKTLKYGSDNRNVSISLKPWSKGLSNEEGGNFHKESVSPYPEIQSYINNYLGGENLIKTWRYFSDGELLVFEVDKKYRYCNNIRREHKSNSIMYVVNLKAGVFYQKCHDPDCRGYKSNEIKLPEETMPWKLLKENESEESDDEMLVAALERVEKEILENNNNFASDLHFQELESNASKVESYLCTPPITEPKCREIVLPSPWSHLSEIETPSKMSETFNSQDESSSIMNSYHESVSDEELLQAYSGLENHLK